MKNIIKSVIATALVLTGLAASAAVVSINVNGTYSQGNGQNDLSGTTISLGGAGSFTLDPGSSPQYFDFMFPSGGTFSTTAQSIEGYYFLRSYALGETIGTGNFGSQVSTSSDWDTILVNGVTQGAWNSSHGGYLGFHTSSDLFGWIKYDYTRANGVSTLTFLNGAYNNVAGQSINAGSVPEPESLALAGLALAGLAIARRKKA